MAPRIIRSSTELCSCYQELKPGDVLVGRIRMHPGEEHLLLDLEARGVRMVPSALSQWLSRSKVFQARILSEFMLPGTRPIYDLHQMMEVVTAYGRDKVEAVVCKLDRANGGMGILRFASAEEVYTQAVLGNLCFPFVAQPFVEGGRDIRVVILGDHLEAYQRHNPLNFRHNLHCGGGSSLWELEGTQLQFCQQIMDRGGFPYAHIDLMLTPSGECWLNEINLRGGLKGARITQQNYLELVEQVHARLLEGVLAGRCS